MLDNRPFGHVVRAIRERPAGVQVDRRLLYLEPDPAAPAEAAANGRPGPIATVLGSVAGIPRQQPILDEILEVTRHNERVRRLRDIIEMAFGGITERVSQVIDIDLDRLVEPPAEEDLARWSEQLNHEAQAATGIGYATYLRSKVSTVVGRYARTICELSDYPEDCNQAAFVRTVLRTWARERLFTERDGRLAPDDRHVAFLRRFDLDYGARRLRFVIAALSWWYEPQAGVPAPPRAELDRAKAVLYDKLAVLTEAMSGRSLGTDLTGLVEDCFQQQRIDEWPDTPEQYADDHADELLALERRARSGARRAARGLRRRALRDRPGGRRRLERADPQGPARPLPRLPALGRDPVSRPVGRRHRRARHDRDHALQPGRGEGRRLLRRDPRGRHDGSLRRLLRPPRVASATTSCGRLHGAERLIGILLPGDDLADARADWCRQAFAAIADEEEGVLPEAAPILAEARTFSPPT